ncbi:MAG TPA: MBG domain-containing protein [Pirellulales bacterium]|nr:MBG domain-containing protein [Pirellulales bacterium]
MSLDSILDRLAGQSVVRRRKKRLRPARFHVEALEARTLLAAITVTDLNPFAFNGADVGLAEAISESDLNPHMNGTGPNVINFNIPGSGVQIISLTAHLPVITAPVIIDATTQPGYAPGQPQIDIDGSKIGGTAQSDGLVFKAGGNTVKGLIINNFNGFGIVLDGTIDAAHNTGPGINNTIQGNFIGTDKTGQTAAPNLNGIDIFNSSYNLIGGVVLPTGQFATGNLISGNTETGIFLSTATDTHNYINGNYIGTDVTGEKPVPNKLDGVALAPPIGQAGLGFASNNFIGGVDPTTNQPSAFAYNVIAGNGADGVLIVGGSGNQVATNLIGLGADGITPVPNGHDGVRLEDASSNVVGGTQPGTRNVISANLHNGVEIVSDAATEYGLAIPVANQGAAGNLVLGNYIGTDVTGTLDTDLITDAQGNKQTVPLGNQNGVELDNNSTDPSVSMSLNVIGGLNTLVQLNAPAQLTAGNVISGNLNDGVLMAGPRVTLNTAEGNYTGTDETGTLKLANARAGVEISSFTGQTAGPSNNTIGGSAAGAGNLISGNGTPAQNGSAATGEGVLIAIGSNGNILEGNDIGVTADGKSPLANVNGVVILDAANNVVGDGNAGNVISGNTLEGVVITGSKSTGNYVQNNCIGADNDVTHPIPNQDGIVITDQASGNFVGYVQTFSNAPPQLLGNTIAGNTNNGLLIEDGAATNQVVANGFGIVEGLVGPGAAAPSNGTGIDIVDSAGNIIGGTAATARNYIDNSVLDGIDINDTNGIAGSGTVVTTGNVVEGNYIGVGNDGSATFKRANGANGVHIDGAASNYIGVYRDKTGNITGLRNVISGNNGDGVAIEGKASSGNVVGGNYIGVAADGATAVGNGAKPVLPGDANASGVVITGGAGANQIGADGATGVNVISANAADGIDLEHAAANNVIKNNVIGLNASGTAALANSATQKYGISISSTPGTIIGATSFSQGGNVISGNTFDGILLSDSPTIETRISGNYIGTDNAAGVPIDNAGFGIDITGLSLIVGPASATIVFNNVISGNLRGGIAVSNGASGNHFTGNFIGTNSQASTTIPNFGVGIEINNAPGNTIGDPDSTLGNQIANTQTNQNPSLGADPNESLGNGILIIGSASGGNHIENNTLAANANDGVMVNELASGNYIGGAAQGNTIINNANNGIAIVTASDTVVQGNLIGLQRGGSAGQHAGNGHTGIILSNAGANLIGTGNSDPTKSLANFIAADGLFGVALSQSSNSNTVAGNLIGTDLQGTPQQGFTNLVAIVITNSSNNVIGGSTQTAGTAPGNWMLGNGAGVIIESNSNGNKIQGNNISGCAGFTTSTNSNAGDAIVIHLNSSNNLIGGADTAAGNTISHNSDDGIIVFQKSDNNSIGNNRIFLNSKLGIDLSPGGNAQQSPPVLELATTGQSHRIAGEMIGSPNTKYFLQFFAGASSQHADGSENDDAEKIIFPSLPASSATGVEVSPTGVTVTTTKGGIGLFDLALPSDIPDGWFVRATATDQSGNTSQFSNAVTVQTDSVGDGVSDAIEAQSPTAGNSSRSLVSIPDVLNNSYITLSVQTSGVQFQNAWSTQNPDPNDGGPPSNTQFGLGFVSFQLTGLQPGASVIVTMTLPFIQTAPTSYWRYLPGPSGTTGHWYEWNWDGNPNHTGAEINGSTIKLHLIDGATGDDDITANGIIVDPGAPGFPDPYTVTNTADSGPGSLRQAILNADANPRSTITFDLPGTGPQTIQPLSSLPAITAGVTIDGSTEPGFAGAPLVVLDGSSAGVGADGLTVASGFATIQDLVICHFSGDGIHVLSAGSALIAGNLIGADAGGKTAEGNGLFGVEIEKVTNDPDNDGDDDIKEDNADTDSDATGSGRPSTIDGGNVISGNLAGGISIHGALAKNNQITNNFIGTQADGISPLGNGGPGVVIDGGSNGNTIGSQPKTGNTIAYNAGPGVKIAQGIDNLIESNSIFANQGLGIELASGGNANESQSAPVLASAASYGGETFVSGTLTSTPMSSFKIDFYATDQANQSGGPQGQSLLGSVNVTTDSNGQASFDATLAASAATGSLITATASLNDNETSAFSAGLALTPTNPMVLIVNTGSDTPDADCGLFTLRQAIVAANAHPGQDVIDFDLPNSDRVIQPQSALPAITDPVIIDGTSQPGYQGLPLVEIDGSQAGAGADGLHITGGGSIVRGLAIHSFSGSGVELSGPGGNTIEGNFLGTDVTGTSGMPDLGGGAFVNGAAGGDVFINGSPDNLIGGTTAAARNVILALDVTGVDATGNRIEGNYVGTDLTGTALLSNSGVGVEISAPSNTIGGLTAGAGNVIDGDLGILNASSNVVQGNLIGTDVTGTVNLSPDTGGGIVVIRGDDITSNFSANNLVGGTTAAARNIIAGGVDLSGAAIYNLVQGNYVGTDITGTASIGASGVSLLSTSASEIPAFNTIGGAEPGAGNLISGVGTGISLSGHNNTIQGNRIGTDVTGTKALSNYGYGIDDVGESDTIGGDLPGEGNLVSGNEQGGIILRGAGGAIVEGNLIGTDYTGTIAIGNGFGPNAPNGNDDGIDVAAGNATIGGSQPGAGNVISDSAASGISVLGPTQNTGLVIQGNFIGTDVTGTKALGNRGDGVTVNDGPILNAVIGGVSPGAGNVISDNGGDGIRISDPLLLADGGEISSGNVIQGNKIGTDVTGTRVLGNAGDGVSIVISNLLASDETIGGVSPGAGNTIAFNGGRGVNIPFGNGNTVRGNDIFDNSGPGLITDINAAASTYAENRGVQLAQAPPVLGSAVFDPRGTVVTGSLTGTPFTRYDVDFFANDKVNATGFGDGQTYLQSISVLVDDTGSVQFLIPLDAAVPIGQWITATATPAPPPSGPLPIPFPNTSLFSQGVPVVAAVDASDIQFSAPTYLVTETGGSAVIVVARSGDTSATAKVDYATHDGSAAAGVNYAAETGTLTFASGVTSQAITVPVQDDGLADGNKDFHILLSNPSGASLGAVNTADVTVADSGSAGQIQFASPTYYVDKVLALQSQEQGSAPPSSFTLTRTGGTEGTVSVEFRVTGGTAGNMDYQDNFGTVIFAPGQTTAQITFGYAYNFINNNRETPVYRGPLTLQVTIGNPTGGAVLGRTTTSVLTIDDPEDQNGAFDIKSQSQVKENAGQAAIEVDRLGQTSTTEQVSYSTVDGTAKAGTNYVATSGTLTFQPGQTQAEIDVPVLDDHLNDNPGSFKVVLSDPTGGALIVDGLGQGSVAILNSDIPPPSDVLVVETINNEGNSGGFIENSGTALVTVVRVNPVTGLADGGGTSGVVQVNYATSDGTAQAGSDYTAESGTLFFGPGQASAHFSVPILPGHDFPDTRTFLVTLSNAVGDAVIGPDNPVTETIYGIPGQIDITSPTYTVAENKAALTVTVALNRSLDENGGLPLGNVTVDYATHDGTATAGVDYTAVSGTLTFSERDVALLLQTTITIPILNDQLLENNAPVFDLTLSNPMGGPTIGIGTAQITIQEDGDAQLSQVPSTTTVTSSAPNGSTYGQSVTLTATVSAASGTPSGAVDFVDTTTGQDLGTVPLTVVNCDGEASLSVSSLGAGSHTIVAHYTGDTGSFELSQGSLTQVVTPATLTITADPKTMVFGATVPGLTDTITGFVNGDTASVVSGAASLSTTATSTSGVGNYPITAGQGTLATANYTFHILGGTLSIVPAKLMLTVVADNQTMVYGSAVPAFTDRIVGFVNGDTASVVSGAPSITTTATSASGVGTYPIDVSLGTLSAANYTFAFIGATLTVTPATLTVTAGSATMVYGAAVPALADTITGFVNGDTTSVVTGAASLSTSATSASGVGIYATMPGSGTLSAANYAFAFANGALSVTPATLTVTADDKTQVYGSANPPLTDTITGFVNRDTSSVVSGTAGLSTSATSASAVGSYAITVGQGTLSSPNYTFNFVKGTLTVTPATLTVTADDKTMVFGASVPALTDRLTGFVNGDTPSVVSGAASLSTTVTSASGVGNYPITVGLGTLNAANYVFSFVNGTLSVSPATLTLTVTADDKTMVYGAAVPALTDTITGFVNGDTASVVSGAASLSTTATSASGVGNYPIDVSLGTLSAANYTFAFVDGTLTITPATLTVTADDKTMVSGATVPPLTDTITGFVNGDTSSAVSGTAGLSTTATSTSGVGSYPITVGIGTLNAANYTFALVNGTLTVAAGGNTPILTLVHDSPASATEGSSATLTSTLLETTDSDSSASASTIVYTVTAAPTLGTLTDKGAPLVTGGSFSQQDINDGNVTYQSTEEGADSFAFSIASGAASPVTGTLAITASDPAVVVTGGFAYPATAGTLGASETVATFADPGGAETLADYATTIDWGDGTSATPGALSVDPNTHAFTISGAHTYAQDGTFAIHVTISHETAAAVTATSTAAIASATGTGGDGIAASGVAVSGYEFSALTGVTVATFTDTNVSLSAGDFSAVINWGDGTASVGSITLASGTYAVTGSHEYLDEGHDTIKVSIDQTAGGVTTGTSATVSALATIHEQRLANSAVGSPNQNYIQEIYRDLFGRQAELQGLDYWVAEQTQGVPRQQVAFRMVKIASFEEFQHDTVTALYEQYLGRAPDAGGLAYWSAYLYDGGTIEGMSQALVSSLEYFQKRGGGTVEGFLSAAFHDALGRQIEPAAVTYFGGLMSKGWSAGDVAASIFDSDEYHRLRVNSLFQQFMDRPADPGALAYFAGELDKGSTDELVISQLLASDEYFAEAQV